ncbi:MAG: cyclase family protein, partial [Methanobacteriaceae archaeon]|nr:cyclase family protein [Methanobacteriaceae archaeon]
MDLSQPLTNDMPIFPQDPDFFLEEKFNNQEHGFSLSLLKTGLHAGTHIDAPYHFYSSGRKIDKISLEELIGSVKIVDINPNNTKPNDLEDMVNLEIKISDFKNVKKG